MDHQWGSRIKNLEYTQYCTLWRRTSHQIGANERDALFIYFLDSEFRDSIFKIIWNFFDIIFSYIFLCLIIVCFAAVLNYFD